MVKSGKGTQTLEKDGKEYILVTLGAPGNHATEQTNIMDAVQVYRRLEKKK